ncbi:UxaA family hydrolase [Marinoscillum furvescens]|uniref:Altronate hydrolase n=1 Tax=Marinoscillum furvescens DSM 4134 TaxID=1122208 RepID=A0A3D9L843_MARFU|nr:altronate dehydratase family protein [Marinoscillum furvescens]REE02010.1 altronate hydrolase [Marinoscillum furvescens DSM 4134]
MEQNQVLHIDARDNVWVALKELSPGTVTYQGRSLEVREPIAQKHKVLLADLKKGEQVIMYGVPVGVVLKNLPAGSLLTIENTKHYAEPLALENRQPYSWTPPAVSKWKERTFNGYHRGDGKVGTANYWLFVPLVFCENRNLKVIEEALVKQLGYYKPNQYESLVSEVLSGTQSQTTYATDRVFENIDGIKFLYHHGGCGGTRQDAETLLRLLAGYVHHPNVAGATVLSLGCQHAQADWFQSIQKELYPNSEKPVLYFEQQQMASEDALISAAITQTLDALKEANEIERKPATLDKLVVGLECGGSDGFSGISANPVLGYVSDVLVTLKASTILSEFPELNGVEQNIINRCETQELAEKFVRIQRAYEQNAQAVGSGFDMNPSPGNIKDGLITDAIKSAGAAKKGGAAPISDILDYTEPVTKPGLNLLCTPGNDVESTTGLAGSGANVILFTTGLGTPTGNPVTPVIKVASNTKLAERMHDIIDVNTGGVIEGTQSIEDAAEVMLEKIISVASGELSKAMQLEQNDFIPWKRGVSL